MRVTERKYFDAYHEAIGVQIPELIDAYDFSESNGGFDYMTDASAVYSSNIEGNSVDLNSFMNYRMNMDKFKAGREIEEIEALVKAYEYAQANPLTEANLLHCHRMFSETLLIESKRGRYREEQVGVFSRTGLVYMAVEPEFVEMAMKQLFDDIGQLLSEALTGEEVFYHASLIHLRFAHIHPFTDGNGRAARLLEKWFLAEKLGRHLWKIPSEEYYKEHQAEYYSAINLGVNFYELDYDRCMSFMEMLPNSLMAK